MKTARFTDVARFAFVAAFLRDAAARDIERSAIVIDEDEYTIAVMDNALGSLLALSAETGMTILPHPGKARDTWFISAPTYEEVRSAARRLARFIVPSFADFDAPSSAFRVQPFTPDASAFHARAAAAFRGGYCRLNSPVEWRAEIMDRAALWSRLELRCRQLPRVDSERQASFRELFARFDTACAGMDWGTAEAALATIRRRHLTSAENLAFLEVQLAFQRQEWRALWQRTDYATLAQLRIPRAVRAALLAAFHHEILLSHEAAEDWRGALDRFTEALPRLGRLLDSRLDLSLSPVIRVFAYQAVRLGDADYLDELRSVAANEDDRACIAALAAFLVGTTPKPTVDLPPWEHAMQCLAESDYGGALRASVGLRGDRERVSILLRIADLSGDAALGVEALGEFDSLPVQDRLLLQPFADRVGDMLKQVTPISDPASTIGLSGAISDWPDWFSYAASSGEYGVLDAALLRLAATTDERFFTGENVMRLGDALLAYAVEAPAGTQRLARRAIQAVANLCLTDDAFPRVGHVYDALYDTLYQNILQGHEYDRSTSQVVLRLADVSLLRSMMSWPIALVQLDKWFEPPVPNQEASVLDAFDLLIDYGLSRDGDISIAISLYRRWVEHLLGLPRAGSLSLWQAWLDLGDWLRAVPDLTGSIQQKIDALTSTRVFDPIAELPTGYRIGIFTLRPGSANRARDRLLARNPALKIEICEEKDLSDRAKHLAQNVDVAVVVATCITHALTYGIGPYVRKPIFPESSGSTSIIRALEQGLLRE